MKLLKLINPENASEDEVKGYKTREAMRVVAIDGDGKIALLYVGRENYYKLPGGGIEEDEDKDKITALRRECKEEIGCDIEILNEIGYIVEYRKMFNLRQTSYCYLVKVKGEKGKSSPTEEEIKRGCKEVWLSYDDAIKALYESKTTYKEGSLYILPRDIAFLEEAKVLIK